MAPRPPSILTERLMRARERFLFRQAIANEPLIMYFIYSFSDSRGKLVGTSGFL